MTWQGFKTLFLDKYFLATEREKKEEEFKALEQGNMTVDQYLAVFTRLARYFPELVSTEEKKVRKFQKGLRRDVGERMATGLGSLDWSIDSEDSLLFGGRLYVPETCREEVLKEFHCLRFAIHPGGNKMYRDLQ